MRAEIQAFLEDASRSPEELPHIDYDRHLEAMMKIYRRNDIDRANVLAEDCFYLLCAYRRYKMGAFTFGMQAVEMMISLLTSSTEQYTRLSEKSIIDLGAYPLGEETFEQYIRQSYYAYDIYTNNAKPKTFPTELDNDNFKAILQRAINAKIVEDKGNGHYEWKKTLYLLAYFAIRVTKVMGIDKRFNAVATWKPFEDLFEIKQGTLRGKPQDWENEKPRDRDKKDFQPEGWGEIETLLNKNLK